MRRQVWCYDHDRAGHAAVQVYGALWNPFLDEAKAAEFVTWGRKHCKLWTQQPPPQSGKPPAHAGWTPFQLSFGRHDVQNVHSAAFLPATHALALGLARGEVLIVERGQAVRSIVAHRPGPQAIRADGSISYGGLRGMALAQNNTALVTAGAAPVGLTPTLLPERSKHACSKAWRVPAQARMGRCIHGTCETACSRRPTGCARSSSRPFVSLARARSRPRCERWRWTLRRAPSSLAPRAATSSRSARAARCASAPLRRPL